MCRRLGFSLVPFVRAESAVPRGAADRGVSAPHTAQPQRLAFETLRPSGKLRHDLVNLELSSSPRQTSNREASGEAAQAAPAGVQLRRGLAKKRLFRLPD